MLRTLEELEKLEIITGMTVTDYSTYPNTHSVIDIDRTVVYYDGCYTRGEVGIYAYVDDGHYRIIFGDFMEVELALEAAGFRRANFDVPVKMGTYPEGLEKICETLFYASVRSNRTSISIISGEYIKKIRGYYRPSICLSKEQMRDCIEITEDFTEIHGLVVMPAFMHRNYGVANDLYKCHYVEVKGHVFFVDNDGRTYLAPSYKYARLLKAAGFIKDELPRPLNIFSKDGRRIHGSNIFDRLRARF